MASTLLVAPWAGCAEPDVDLRAEVAPVDDAHLAVPALGAGPVLPSFGLFEDQTLLGWGALSPNPTVFADPAAMWFVRSLQRHAPRRG